MLFVFVVVVVVVVVAAFYIYMHGKVFFIFSIASFNGEVPVLPVEELFIREPMARAIK